MMMMPTVGKPEEINLLIYRGEITKDCRNPIIRLFRGVEIPLRLALLHVSDMFPNI